MAYDQVDLVREAQDAYRAGGIEALLRYTDPPATTATDGRPASGKLPPQCPTP
jgi:hypothetical protein